MKKKNAQISEIIKCGKDPIYFFNKYCKIQHMTRGTIPFNTYPFQDDCVKAFIDHRFNIILKSRQLGLSTLTAAYSVWLTLFQKDKRVLVIATKLDVAQNFIQKVKTIMAYLPKWMIIVDTITNNKQFIEFSHGSSIKAIPTSDDAGRSEALSLLIVDEAAFVRNFDTIWTGIYPTLTTGGRAIVLSTPNGVGGQYYKLYTDAEDGINEFNPIKLPWTVNPDTDEEWFEKMTANMTKRQISQEFLCDFISSGETLIGAEEFDWLKSMVKDPVERTGPNADIWIWRYPLNESKYLISADVSRGDSKDFSAFHVIDVGNREVVAEFKGKIPPDGLGQLLVDWGKRYNNAVLVPENNNYGYATLMKIRDLGYNNVYLRKKKKASIVIYNGKFNIDNAGFNTNQKTKGIILTKLEELIRTKNIKVYSSRFYDESKRFVWKGNRAEAMNGYNDDLVMSMAIGSYIMDTEYGNIGTGKDINAAMLAAMSVNSTKFQQDRYSKSQQEMMSRNNAGKKNANLNPNDTKKPGINASEYWWLF